MAREKDHTFPTLIMIATGVGGFFAGRELLKVALPVQFYIGLVVALFFGSLSYGLGLHLSPEDINRKVDKGGNFMLSTTGSVLFSFGLLELFEGRVHPVWIVSIGFVLLAYLIYKGGYKTGGSVAS